MKNIVAIGIVGLLVLSGIGAAAFSTGTQKNAILPDFVSFSQPIRTVQNDVTHLELPESTASLMQTGKPLLPMVSKVYIFPFGTTITDVDVTFGSTYELSLETPLRLSPQPQMLSLDITQTPGTYHEGIQSQEVWYPSTPFTYRVGTGLDDDERVVFVVVHLYPVCYKQETCTLRYSQDASILISYSTPIHPTVFGNAYTLLILTPSQFTAQLQPLVNYKNDNGVPTTMVTLNSIPHVGVDVQEDIKYYIKYAIETWGITSVILVGAGVEGQEIFPVRNAWIPSGSYEQFFPSDLYYADIYDQYGGFCDWDYNNNGKYCEYPWDLLAVDLYPDVYLSRLACNDGGEVTSVVNKIIDFAEHNKIMKKILQLGGDTFPGDDENINEGEYSNGVVLTKLPGYSSTRLWASLGTLTKDNIRSNINKGVDFVDLSGHGSWASWVTHPPNNDNVWLPASTFYSPYTGFLYVDVEFCINSRKLPVFVLNACSTSKFSESPNCLSWKIVSKSRGGGIASFGASGIGYGIPGTDETKRLWGWMEVRLFMELTTTKTLGKVWANVIRDYLNTFFMFDDADYKTIVEMNLFGDPTTVIDDGKNPRPFSFTQVSTNHFIGPGILRSLCATMLESLKLMKERYRSNY